MKKLLFISFLLFISTILWSNTISFKWAVLRNDEILPLSPRIKVHPGDRFKFYIHPGENTYVYLIVYSEEKGFEFLFPGNLESFPAAGYQEKEYFIPPMEEWYELPGTPGGEREFFFIASSTPLKKLDTYLEKVMSPEVKSVLYKELKTLLKDYTAPEVLIEKAVSITGNIKGNDEVPKVRSIECSSLFIDWFTLVF